MSPEPNLFKIEADLRNLGQNFCRMNEETREYRKKQMEILGNISMLLEHHHG